MIQMKSEIRYNRLFLKSKGVHKVNSWIILFGALAAILVSWFIREIYLDWQDRRVLTILSVQMEIANKQTQQQLQQIQINNQHRQTKPQEKAKLKFEYKLQLPRLAIEYENQSQTQKIAIVEEKNAK